MLSEGMAVVDYSIGYGCESIGAFIVDGGWRGGHIGEEAVVISDCESPISDIGVYQIESVIISIDEIEIEVCAYTVGVVGQCYKIHKKAALHSAELYKGAVSFVGMHRYCGCGKFIGVVNRRTEVVAQRGFDLSAYAEIKRSVFAYDGKPWSIGDMEGCRRVFSEGFINLGGVGFVALADNVDRGYVTVGRMGLVQIFSM